MDEGSIDRLRGELLSEIAQVEPLVSQRRAKIEPREMVRHFLLL